MKILMIGLGSIGQRHLRNLSALLEDNVDFSAYRVRGLQRTFSNDMSVRDKIELDKEYNITVYHNLDDALQSKPDVAFITNITSQHVTCAKAALEMGIDVFIEKPLSDTYDDVDELIDIKNKKHAIAFMGFQNRLHPGLIKLKEIVKNLPYGNIISVHAEIGERLTSMHKYENYAETYMARKDMGGGVIINQMIHELDYIQWIFGCPDEVYSVSGKKSSLDINVEDCCDAIYNYSNSNYSITVHADFIQYPPKRYCKVIFENATVIVDLIANKIDIIGDNYETHSFNSFTRNDMFIAELKLFLDAIQNRNQQSFTLEEGSTSLKMAIAAKQSSIENKTIKIRGMSI